MDDQIILQTLMDSRLRGKDRPTNQQTNQLTNFMATKKLSDQTTTLQTWDEVNDSLHKIARINATVAKFSSAAEIKKLKIEKELDEQTATFIQQKMQLERDIELFAKDNRDAFDESRTKLFTFGLVKLRWLPKKVSMLPKWTIAKAIAEIKRLKKYADDFIRVKEEINKDAIQASNLPADELAKFGVVMTQDEEFYYESFKTELPGME